MNSISTIQLVLLYILKWTAELTTICLHLQLLIQVYNVYTLSKPDVSTMTELIQLQYSQAYRTESFKLCL
jgi:hypothetical protein